MFLKCSLALTHTKQNFKWIAESMVWRRRWRPATMLKPSFVSHVLFILHFTLPLTSILASVLSLFLFHFLTHSQRKLLLISFSVVVAYLRTHEFCSTIIFKCNYRRGLYNSCKKLKNYPKIIVYLAFMCISSIYAHCGAIFSLIFIRFCFKHPSNANVFALHSMRKVFCFVFNY